MGKKTDPIPTASSSSSPQLSRNPSAPASIRKRGRVVPREKEKKRTALNNNVAQSEATLAGPSSADVLQRLRAQKQKMNPKRPNPAKNAMKMSKKTDFYTTLIQDIRDYVLRKGGGEGEKERLGERAKSICRGPTTSMLLAEFSSVQEQHGAVFKRLLKTVAHSVKGRWQLREEYA
uniref:Uncharacterized protein n=1 Tax=Corethron hystrix TaxID=216773 RepID=A0A7S1BEA5_9STRA|mmetsp:Transcript_24582/g.56272  ORF Transcript_24582/g.56272 Transcript_24582/m.56272 type:complete len:176 (+) Transcript_24582:72-599(+)